MRETLPDLKQLTDAEKDALIVELWEENQSLGKQLLEMAERLAKIEEKLNKPPKTSKKTNYHAFIHALRNRFQSVVSILYPMAFEV